MKSILTATSHLDAFKLECMGCFGNCVDAGTIIALNCRQYFSSEEKLSNTLNVLIFQFPATNRKQNIENMKNNQTKIVILKNAIVLFLLMEFILGNAPIAARNENLPPGKNMNRVGWIQVPLADPFHLIVCSKDVQKELRITQKQLSQFKEMEPLFRSELRELTYHNDQKSHNTIQRHINAARSGMGRVLNPTQLKRLRQLLLQLHGPCSVVNDQKLSVLLKITDQQAKEINSILDALKAKSDQVYTLQNKENRQPAGSPLPGVGSKQKHMRQLLQRLNSKVYNLFSDEQKKIYQEAEGKPFSFKLAEDPACLDDSP